MTQTTEILVQQLHSRRPNKNVDNDESVDDDTSVDDDMSVDIDNQCHVPFVDNPLVLTDIFAILLASQLIGLLDIVNNPDFGAAGGWLQPIPAVPSSFILLVRRITSLTMLWLVSVFFASKLNSKEEEGGITDLISIIESQWFQAQAIFVYLRMVLAWMSNAATGFTFNHNNFNAFIDNFAVALRDCYFVLLFVWTLRSLYKHYFW